MGNFYDLINTKNIFDIMHPNYKKICDYDININDIEYIINVLSDKNFNFKENFIVALIYKNETNLVKKIFSNVYYQKSIKDIYLYICAINNNFELLEFMCKIHNQNI
jgi:hypothetical protein